MSIDAWYFHKAEQCDRLAAAADNATTRAKHKEDAELWRQIAHDAAKQGQTTRP